jgi:hypothetical protein
MVLILMAVPLWREAQAHAAEFLGLSRDGAGNEFRALLK